MDMHIIFFIYLCLGAKGEGCYSSQCWEPRSRPVIPWQGTGDPCHRYHAYYSTHNEGVRLSQLWGRGHHTGQGYFTGDM